MSLALFEAHPQVPDMQKARRLSEPTGLGRRAAVESHPSLRRL